MDVRCPYCRDAIASRSDGVRCAECATPTHEACWKEHGGTCVVRGCTSRRHMPFTRRAAGRIVIGAGRRAVRDALHEARERLGGKSVVGLFALSILVTGLGVAPLLYELHATPLVSVEVSLGGLFAVLAAWITGLLYRGHEVHDDLELRPAQQGPANYYRRLWGGLTGERPDGIAGGGCGCAADGCAYGGIEGGALGLGVLLVLLVLGLVLPLVAWLAVELVFPVIILGTYTVLYGALAVAVNGRPELEGRFGACLWRGVLYGLIYSLVVAAVIGVGVTAFRAIRPPPESMPPVIELPGEE